MSNLSNLFSMLFGKQKFQPSKKIQQSLLGKFPDILNIEWNKNDDFFEAIFYKDNLEYIALLDNNGLLIEYRKFLPVGYMPEVIKTDLSTKGEIMNIVMINKGNSITYEVIMRDKELVRFMLLLDEQGNIISERLL